MQFKTNLIKGKLVKRYKRFLADVVLNDGKKVTVHCPNPGSMMNLTTEGAVVWLEPNDDPKKKLKYGWRLVESNNQAICVDTTVANQVDREALEKKEISQLNYQSFILVYILVQVLLCMEVQHQTKLQDTQAQTVLTLHLLVML